MTVEDFEQFLGEYTDQLEDLNSSLTPLVNQMVNDLKSDAPDNKGDLRRSIVGAVRDYQVEFGMLGYGIAQNYGVKGTKSSYGVEPIQDGIPGAGSTMSFKSKTIGGNLPYGVRKSIAEKGLKPKNWFDMDEMTQLIVDEITRLTTENNNN
jgi:hypothetical protein